MRIGTTGGIGPVRETPTRESSQPFWNTAVMTPKAAPADSRFITAAGAGIRRLRNTTISSRKDNATNIPTNIGNFEESVDAASPGSAVRPPTQTVAGRPRTD